MCSTTADEIARICGAIEELASRAAQRGGETAAPPATAGDDVAGRLAAIWEMIADVDPELAKRLPGYLSAAD